MRELERRGGGAGRGVGRGKDERERVDFYGWKIGILCGIQKMREMHCMKEERKRRGANEMKEEKNEGAC